MRRPVIPAAPQRPSRSSASSALRNDEIDCTIVYGVSAGGGNWYDNAEAERLGYRPAYRIVDFAAPEAFVDQPVPLNDVADIYQGGPFTTWGHDGVVRGRRLPVR